MSKKFQFDNKPVMVLRLLFLTQLTHFVKIEHIDLSYLKLFFDIDETAAPVSTNICTNKMILLIHLQTNKNLSRTIAE